MIKKILIVIIAGNLILSGWFFRDFFKNLIFQSRETVIDLEKQEQEKNNTNKTETADQKKIEERILLASGEIKAVSWNRESGLIYYNQNNFLETDLKGSYKKTLSSYPFENLKTIQCSKSGKFCLVFSDGFSVYNLETKENNKLPDQTVDANLNYQGDGLIYLMKLGNKNYQLASADLSGENQILLNKITGENLKIAVNPKNNDLIYYATNTTRNESGIALTNLIEEKQLDKIVRDDIVDANWSPDGKKILFSFYDHSVSPKRIQLGYYDLNQNKQFNLGLPGIAQKCAWGKDSSVLYCGILASAEPKEFVLNDWYSREFVSRDVFWKIDLLTAERKRLFDDQDKYPIVDSFSLFIEGQELFFGDKISGNLVKRSL